MKFMEGSTLKAPTVREESSRNMNLWNRLARKITALYSRERKENEPRLRIKIIFSPHGTAEEASVLEKDFKECDIFIPEAFGWTAPIEQSLNDVSQGLQTPDRYINKLSTNLPFREHLLAQAEMIYNSKKPIIFIDIPFDHPNREVGDKNTEKYLRRFETVKNFDDYFELSKEYLLEVGRLESEREKIIEESFFLRIKSFLDKNPKYKSKKELEVLISLGTVHTPVFFDMRSKGLDASREFREPLPILFDLYSEITRTATLGKSATDDMIARFILEDVTDFWFTSEHEPSDSFFRQFSYEEIKDLFSAGISYNKRGEFKEKLKILITQKKLKFPKFLQESNLTV